MFIESKTRLINLKNFDEIVLKQYPSNYAIFYSIEAYRGQDTCYIYERTENKDFITELFKDIKYAYICEKDTYDLDHAINILQERFPNKEDLELDSFEPL